MCINPKSPYLSYANESERTLYWFKADCKLWTCEECSQKNKTRVAARAGRGAEYFEKIGYPVQFTTLTTHRKVRGKHASIERWRECWPKLRKRVSRRVPEFHYAVFPEQHKDGAMHIHVLETSGLTKRWFKDNCANIGLGFMADVQEMGNSGRVVSYVTKYMAKAIEVTDWPPRFHRFRFSRQWPDIEHIDGHENDWRVFLSEQSFDDELRYWHQNGYRIVNTRTGELI